MRSGSAGGGELLGSDPNAARIAAIDAARNNFADGSRVLLEDHDVQFINWNEKARTYDVLSGAELGSANGVRVSAHRTSERGNAVDMPFARIIGSHPHDVTARAIATAEPRKYGLVGLESIKLSANAHAGPAANDGRGAMASNGDITLAGNASVDGDARPGVGRRVIGSSGKVSGSVTPLATPLVYPPASAGAATTRNSNNSIVGLCDNSILLARNKRLNLPPGTYYVKDIRLAAGSELKFTGPATVYVTGNIDLAAQASIRSVRAYDLKIIMLGTGTIDLNGYTAIHASLYAPQTALVMRGSGVIFGSVVARSIELSGSAAIQYELSPGRGVALVE